MANNIGTKVDYGIAYYDNLSTQQNNQEKALSGEGLHRRGHVVALPPPQVEVSHADVISAQRKIENPLYNENMSLDPGRAAQRETAVKQTAIAASTEVGANKISSYKELAQSIISLSTPLLKTGLLTVTTTTGNGVGALLSLSTMSLANAIINAAFAAINIMREKQDLPPVSVAGFMQGGMVYILQKMDVPEYMINKIDMNTLRKTGTVYKLTLTVLQMALSQLITFAKPAGAGLLLTALSGAAFMAPYILDYLFPDAETQDSVLSATEEEGLEAMLTQSNLEKSLATEMAQALVQEILPNAIEPHPRPLTQTNFA